MRRASPTPGQHPPSYPGGGGGGAPGQPSTSGRNFVAENKLGAGAPTRIARPGSQVRCDGDLLNWPAPQQTPRRTLLTTGRVGQARRRGKALPLPPPAPLLPSLPLTFPCQEDDGLKYLSKADYGRVPTYLLQRKIEMAEAAAEAERAKELALVPPGERGERC